jgi:hypothetical protein
VVAVQCLHTLFTGPYCTREHTAVLQLRVCCVAVLLLLLLLLLLLAVIVSCRGEESACGCEYLMAHESSRQ